MLGFQQEGSVLNGTRNPAADTAAGTPVDMSEFGYKSGLIGVNSTFIPSGVVGSYQTGGVFEASNEDGLAGSADDDAFYHVADEKFVAAAGAGILLIGKVLQDFVATDSDVRVLLNDKIAEQVRVQVLKSAMQELRDVMVSNNAENITYRRGNYSVSLVVKRGRSEFETLEGDANLESLIKSIDFVIKKPELILNGAQTDPQRGDEITDSDGAVYELLPGVSENSWRWTNSYKLAYRVHTLQRTGS